MWNGVLVVVISLADCTIEIYKESKSLGLAVVVHALRRCSVMERAVFRYGIFASTSPPQ